MVLVDFLQKLKIAGLDDDLVQRIIKQNPNGNNIAAQIVALIENGGFESTTVQKRAHQIMGDNFFDIQEAISCFKLNPSRQQLANLSRIPFSEKELTGSKNTHILVPVFPLSIIEIRGKVDQNLFLRHKNAWYNDQPFARERSETSWRLTPIPDNSQKQLVFLDKEDEVPTAQAMAYTIIGYYLATGKRLFENAYMRTSSLDSGGYPVYVGYFKKDLYILYHWPRERFASDSSFSRKPLCDYAEGPIPNF